MEKPNAQQIIDVIRPLQASSPEDWIDLAKLGAPLAAAGIDYKKLGYGKLRPFLELYLGDLEFQSKDIGEGKPPVYYVRPSIGHGVVSPRQDNNEMIPTGNNRTTDAAKSSKYPTKSSTLFGGTAHVWAIVPHKKIIALADKALDERWDYGDVDPANPPYTILKNYLRYTFKKLVLEDKVRIEEDKEDNREYAAFNTGLVDKKYDYIFALFSKNLKAARPYWHLFEFVTAGEGKGKILTKLFAPLPQKADYFEGKIENMLYDTTTGDLNCDYTHILTERTGRFPLEFFDDECPDGFTSIDGTDIQDVYFLPEQDKSRIMYFEKLGKKISDNPKVLRRMVNRIKDATEVAVKRVEWNYKTAIPMYYPTRNSGSLLLPLSLIDEERVDLALVVERQRTGAYQGQTILPLNLAYNNSRLVARPDSDWLKTEAISTSKADDSDDDIEM